MRRGSIPTLWVTVLVAGVAAAAGVTSDRTLGERWWAHVAFLADDRLEGRNTGSPGHRKAAEYVAKQFELAGARPGGVRGYVQPVAFVARQIQEGKSSLALVRGGVVVPLALGSDVAVGLGYEPAPALIAPLVFAGYGLAVPEKGYDDRKGIDLRGKIAVCLQGGPSSLAGPLRAHAQSTAVRWQHLREAGAVGLVTIANPKSMDIPWERATLARLQPAMALADPALSETRGMKLSVRVNPAKAEKWFEGSGHRFSDLLALAERGKQLPRFPLRGELRARVAHRRWPLESQNVIGVIPGSDASLRREYVVVSAHLDHLGIGGANAGDSIYNGAMDNASGVGALIEIARLAHESGWKPRRSLVLLAVTGEEKGLQGSRYFAAHPTVGGSGTVADLNMDMFLPIVPLRILTVYGLDESDLGDWIRPVARRMGIRVQGDQQPQRNIFTRSDQYSFIRRGVPALMFGFGAAKGTPEERTFQRWVHERYHSPSDDVRQPVDKKAAGRYTRLLFEYCRVVTDRDEPPRWKPGSFFRRFVSKEPARRPST